MAKPLAETNAVSRQDQKAKSRLALKEALLELSQDEPITSVGLREVTRAAGMAPTSFYRHFKNMEELVIEVTEDFGLQLRDLSRKARSRVEQDGKLVESSIKVFLEFLEADPRLLKLIAFDRMSGPPYFRKTISKARQQFTEELVEDLVLYINSRGLYGKYGFTRAFIEDASDLIVNHVLYSGLDYIGATKKEKRLLEEKLVRQTKIIWMGKELAALDNDKSKKQSSTDSSPS